jgi:hypothetical protein
MPALRFALSVALSGDDLEADAAANRQGTDFDPERTVDIVGGHGASHYEAGATLFVDPTR